MFFIQTRTKTFRTTGCAKGAKVSFRTLPYDSCRTILSISVHFRTHSHVIHLFHVFSHSLGHPQRAVHDTTLPLASFAAPMPPHEMHACIRSTSESAKALTTECPAGAQADPIIPRTNAVCCLICDDSPCVHHGIVPPTDCLKKGTF